MTCNPPIHRRLATGMRRTGFQNWGRSRDMCGARTKVGARVRLLMPWWLAWQRLAAGKAPRCLPDVLATACDGGRYQAHRAEDGT